jgi:hypothetical protein
MDGAYLALANYRPTGQDFVTAAEFMLSAISPEFKSITVTELAIKIINFTKLFFS